MIYTFVYELIYTREEQILDKSLILIGMPGAGKTTIGKRIAEKLKVEFIDTDNLIIDVAGKPLQKIISEDGMEVFKDLECKVLSKLKLGANAVVSTGGSAVLYEEAMMHLKTLGKIVFLDADLPLIKKRIWNADSRGLAFVGDSEDKLLDIYMQREPLYYKYSDVRVPIRGKTVAEITRVILDAID